MHDFSTKFLRTSPFIVLLIVVSAITITHAVPLNASTTSEPIGISVTITSAYYADIDTDGWEDDIYSSVTIDLTGAVRYNFDYYITLTLPSGTSYTYHYSINTVYDVVNFGNYFWNHATESGDYSISVKVVLWTGGISSATHQYIFDPPGGSDGGDPTFDITTE